jgi:hypothetical protein
MLFTHPPHIDTMEIITGVDMFPHTPHVELFSVLKREHR